MITLLTRTLLLVTRVTRCVCEKSAKSVAHSSCVFTVEKVPYKFGLLQQLKKLPKEKSPKKQTFAQSGHHACNFFFAILPRNIFSLLSQFFSPKFV
jgi:hypothetical protein